MGKPTVASTTYKWIILTVILVVAAFGLTTTYWMGIFLPGKVQKIYFGSSEWSHGLVNLYIANTGADELIISKVWINVTLLDSTEWESFPSMRFEPGDQGVLQITPSLISFKSGTAYQFTIKTEAGNSFSHTATAEWQSSQAGVLLTKESVSWPTATTISVVVRNTGTSNGKITAVYIGTSSTNLNLSISTSPTPGSSSATIDVESSTTFTITYSAGWDADTRYYFKFATDTAAILEFSEKSPTTFTFMQTEELKIVSRTWGASNAYIDLTVRNTGTASLTMSGAEVNGAAAASHNATGSLAANAQTVVRITQSFTSGQKYEFAILTSAGNKYTYTATAP